MRDAVRWLALALVLGGCRRAETTAPQGSTARAEVDASGPAVPFVVRDDATDLMFFWFDERGAAHPVRRVSEVPSGRRGVVRVDPARPESRAAGWVYVADLRALRADGTYAVRTVPAEALASQVLAMAGHEGSLGSPTAAPVVRAAPGDAGAMAAQRPTVIIYGASWCSACHQAAEYLRGRQIAFVEKDIEQDPAAAQEMMDKARRAGVPTGSIPILDVRGRIMAGFSPPEIERALRS